MKRIFELESYDLKDLTADKLVKIIRNSEGRTLMSETVVSCEPLSYGTTNAELAASFGADMITLNVFDFDNPFIHGLDDLKAENIEEKGFLAAQSEALLKTISKNKGDGNYIRRFRKIVGRPIGVNLEPISESNPVEYPKGLTLTKENIVKAVELGFDYIVITGNPKTGIAIEDIKNGIELARSIAGDDLLIIAGKMHGAGGKNVYDGKEIKKLAKAGAHVVMIGAPGTVPGMTLNIAKKLVDIIHENGALAKTAMGTSQEGATPDTIRRIAFESKMSGADIIHIGDAGFSGIADPENIKEASIAIRGKRHTYRRIACRR